MQCDQLEDLIINKLDNYFNKAIKDYFIKESTDLPSLQLVMEMNIYNYYVIRITVEKGILFASIVESGFLMDLFKFQISEETLEDLAQNLDSEIRLRIPDKYLIAKGW